MLLTSTERQGGYDGVDTPKDMDQGAIHPSELPRGSGGHACAKGARGAVDGIVRPCWW
jgi:hypothetical protein